MTAATSREGEWCCMTYHLYSSAYIRRKQNRRGQREWRALLMLNANKASYDARY